MAAVSAVTALVAAAAVSPPVLEVYGQRWAIRPVQAPTIAATTGERAQVEQAQDRGLVELLQELPGVATTDDGALGGQQRTSVRGASARQTGVFLDAVPLAGGFDGAANIGRIDLFGIETVDVWRSGAPAELGAQPIGGAIRLNTQRIADRRTRLRTGYGAWNTLHLAAGHAQPIGRGGLLGSVSWRQTDGDFPYRSDNGTAYDPSDDQTLRRGNNDSRQLDILARGELEQRAVRLSVWHAAHTFAGGLPGNGLRQPTVAERDERRFVSAAEMASVRPGSWTVGVYHTYLRQRQRDPFQEFGITPNDSDNRATRVGGYGYGEVAGRHRLTWPWAIRTDAEWYDPEERLSAAPDPPDARRTQADLRTGLRAGLPRQPVQLAVDIGMQFVYSDVARIESFGGQLLVPDPVVRVRPDVHLGVTWQPSLYASFRTGFTRAGREPTLFELFGDGAFVLPANRVLRPETAHSIDVGVTLTPEFAHGIALLVDAAAFASWHRDLIQFVRSTSDTFVARNQDGARLLGSEWLVRFAWRNRLEVAQAYDWLDARQKSTQAAEQGKPLPLRTRHRGRTSIAWMQPVIDDWSAGLRARWRIESPHTVDTTGTVEVPGRRQLDLTVSAGWRLPELRLDVTLYNVFNRQQMDLIAYPLPGRHWMVALASTF